MTDKNAELLPCPFCGGRAEVKVGAFTSYVMCLKCEVMGPNLSSYSELVQAWNRRALATAPQDAELGKELDRFICEFCDNLQNDGADGEDQPMTDDQRKFAREVIDGLLGDPEWDDLWGRVIESRARQRPQQQDDCVRVPVEPTYAMLCALSGEWHPHKFGNARERYAALLAAAKELKT